MNQLSQIKLRLQELAAVSKTSNVIFFKTGVGQYSEHDTFIGVSVPMLRQLAKEFYDLSLPDIQGLLESPVNEERSLGLFILVSQYQKSSLPLKDKLYNFYLHNLQYVNNWNLVDASAHLILGAHLSDQADKTILEKLAQSENIWYRRIAIISTLYFIRKDDFEWTIKIATALLNDTHDLIHKAVGWMLREVGERDQSVLIAFLDKHAIHMPRTMLRYAIEKFPENQRKAYLMQKKI